MARTGRRPGRTRTRDGILLAARAEFSRLGYDRATMRGIAGRAGVDPALVHHYFGGKEGLFAAALELPFDPAEVVPTVLLGGVDRVGERLVRVFLHIWDAGPARESLLGVLRSALANARAAAMLREFVTSAIVGRVAASLGTPDATTRATLAGFRVAGIGDPPARDPGGAPGIAAHRGPGHDGGPEHPALSDRRPRDLRVRLNTPGPRSPRPRPPCRTRCTARRSERVPWAGIGWSPWCRPSPVPRRPRRRTTP